MHIIHVITSLFSGGAQSALCRLCLNDRKNRHTVIVMIGGGELEKLLVRNGIRVEALGFTRTKGFFRGTYTLLKLLRSYRPDLVQTWMYHPDLIGGLCARVAGVRHVCWGIRHTELEEGTSSRSSIISARLCAILSGIVPSKIICCAYRAARVHEVLGYRSSKMVVIPNGYDLEDYFPREVCVNPDGLLSDEERQLPILGMVGRFNAQKDHRNLLAALARVMEAGIDFRCLLVGAELNKENAKLVGWIAEYKLEGKVKLSGLRSDIPDIMNCLDLHILSSSFGEAFPNVIAEAMACGTPCVATDVGDTSLIIDRWGWVVPPRDPLKLAEAILAAIKELRTSPVQWEERQRASAEHIQNNFSIRNMVKSYDSVWSECMEANKKCAFLS